jgi:hypothetical protein
MFGAPLLGPGHDALDTIRVAQHINNRGVRRHPDASVLEQTVAGLVQHQGSWLSVKVLPKRIGSATPPLDFITARKRSVNLNTTFCGEPCRLSGAA